MRRVSLDPDWRGPFEKWSRKYAHENFWKIRDTVLDREDAVQECAVIFAKVCKRYGHTIDDPAWFMSIYQRCVYNHFTTMNRRQEHFDWKKKRPNGKLQTVSLEGNDINLFDLATQSEHELVDFWLSASPEIRNVFNILSYEGASDLCYRLLDAKQGELDKHWLRVLELDNEMPIIKELQLLISTRICADQFNLTTKDFKMAASKKKTTAANTPAIVEKNKTLSTLIEAIRKEDPKFALQGSDEVYTDYLTRIIRAGNKIADETFNAMPDDVQAYWNEAAKAIKTNKDVPMPPGFDGAALVDAPAAKPVSAKAAKDKPAKADPVPETAGDAAETDGANGDAGEPDGADKTAGDASEPTGDADEPEVTGDAVQEKPKRVKGEKKPKEVKVRKNLINGFSVVDMRKLVIENPAVTVADLMKMAEDKGIKDIQKSTVTIARATTLTVIRLMKDTGHWKD